jgi:3-oxoisoapionate kinase
MTIRPTSPLYGWYGDDFTGATDTLATLSTRGVRSFLFLGPPSANHLARAGDIEAIGIAGAARAMDPAEMEQELRAVGAFFAASGVRLLHYKCCSTFDSAATVGNIAKAMSILRSFVGQPQVLILGGQPSLGRYCAFGNLFATTGSGEGVYRLDRHPTMSRHPSTPMKEADLRQHLQALGADKIGLVDWVGLDEGRIAIGEEPNILFDATRPSHVETIGQELRRRARNVSLLAVGASSVAEAMYGDRVDVTTPLHVSGQGPVLAIAGSLSPLTRRQVEAATSFVRIKANAVRLVTEENYREDIAATLTRALRDERHVLLTTAPDDAESVSGADPQLARTVGRFADRLLAEVPVHRLIAAGGDTSSHIAQSLNLWGLAHGGQISPGVAISIGRSDDPDRDGISLMLKGGQMGHVNLFEEFANGCRQSTKVHIS